MLGLMTDSNVRLRSLRSGVARLGTSFGVFSVLVFLTGCPPVTNDCNTADDPAASCDDNDPCTVNTCLADGSCGSSPKCAAGEDCNTDTGECTTACADDAECDDGNECTTDTCGADGVCSSENNTADCDDGDLCTDGDVCGGGTCSGDSIDGCCEVDADCADTETCEANVCTPGCTSAGDCDDQLACTDDSCVNGVCTFTQKDCDNGIFCDGVETCDDVTGDCVSPGDPCDAATQDCTEATGTCDAKPTCTTDADCADGVFCNGAETCNAAGDCIAGTRACSDAGGAGCTDATATEFCEEGDTAAVCTPCPSPSQDFTLGQDNLVGTTGDDVFNGPIEFSPGAGAQIETLQTGDKATGLAGNDTLNATSNGGAATPTIDGIETINVSVFDGGFALAANKITGATNVNSVDSTQLLTVNNLPNAVGLGLMNTDSGITASFDAGATAGTADNLAITLDPVQAGTVTVTPAAASGFESFSIASTGTGKNTLTNVTQTASTSLVKGTFTGAQAMELRRTDNTVVTFDGSAMTGALTLGTGDGSTAAAYAAFHAGNVNIKTMTGGTGNDMFVFGTTFNGNDASGTTEFIDGGTGTDGMQATLSSSIGSVLPIKGIENLFLNATATSSLNMTGVTGIANVTIDGASGGPSTDAITLLNISGSPLPSLDFRGDSSQAAQGYDAITYQSTGTGGSGDALTITIGNRGKALNASGTTNGHTVGALTVPFIENLTCTASDGPATVTTGITASTLVSLTANGSSNLTLNTLTTGGTDSITSINAGGVVGNFSVTCADLATGASLTSGGGNDAFTVGDSGSTSSVITLGGGNDTLTSTDANSADVINAGAGTDTIESDGGSDTISTGSEADTVIFTRTATADKNTISDFTAGAAGDVALFDISALGLAGGTEFVGLIAGVANVATDEIIILTVVGYATQGAADTAINTQIAVGGANLDQVYFYFDTGSNTTKIIHFTSSDAGASTLIGELTNITTQAAHDTLTIANIDSRA